LQAADLAGLRDRLSAEGFPPAMIRAILAVQIREGFAGRRKALETLLADAPFWKNSQVDPKVTAELRALSKAEQRALSDLLGPDPDNGVAASLRREYPNLSAEKIDQLAAIRERYDGMRQDLYTLAGGAFTPDVREKATALDKAMHAEFAAVLSPQELEDYDLRASNTASSLRSSLSAFDPTEAEFRALFKLQSAFYDQFGPMYVPPSPDQMRARSEAQKQLNEDIKAALGPDRYTDYQRATDYNFRQTSQLVSRLELPPETANQVYAVQKDIQQRATAVYQPGPVSPDNRVAQLAALADEAKTKITAVLGDRGFEAYKQYGGSWLQMLQPRLPPKN
jgi:hypothetical protein